MMRSTSTPSTGRGALVLVAVLTGVSAVLLVASFQLQATAATVPIVVAVPTLLVLIEQLVRENRRRTPVTLAPEISLGRREQSTLAWMLFLLVLMWSLGVVVALPVYLLLHLRVRSRESWVVALTIALVVWLVLFGGLGALLGVEPPAGAIWEWFHVR